MMLAEFPNMGSTIIVAKSPQLALTVFSKPSKSLNANERTYWLSAFGIPEVLGNAIGLRREPNPPRWDEAVLNMK